MHIKNARCPSEYQPTRRRKITKTTPNEQKNIKKVKSANNRVIFIIKQNVYSFHVFFFFHLQFFVSVFSFLFQYEIVEVWVPIYYSCLGHIDIGPQFI